MFDDFTAVNLLLNCIFKNGVLVPLGQISKVWCTVGILCGLRYFDEIDRRSWKALNENDSRLRNCDQALFFWFEPRSTRIEPYSQGVIYPP
jgi:hypothetical protein